MPQYTDRIFVTGSGTTFNVSGSSALGDAAADVVTVTGQLTASQGGVFTLHVECDDTLNVDGAATFGGNVTLGNAAADAVTVTGQLTASQGALFSVAPRVADDIKLYFGTGQDASISYDETASDKLIISGAAGGTMFQIPDNSGEAFEFRETDTIYMTVSSVDGQEAVSFSKRLVMLDDTAIALGTGQDATIEYDENGTDELRFAGAAATFEQAVTFDANVTLGDAAADVITSTGQFTASQGAKFSNDVFLAADDVKLYFGTGNDSNIMYGNSGGGNEFTLTVGADGGGIQMPDNDGAAFEIREAGNTYMRFNTGDSYADVRCPKPFGVMDNITLNIGTPAASGVPGTLEYDADGTQELVISPPPNGMSVGSGFHRIAVDLSITKADSGDNDVANQLFMIDGSTPVKIPNDAIITRVVAIPKALSNLGTALYNVQISATSATAADSAISSGTELLGAGGSGTADSNGGSASDITMSSGGVLKKVWYNTTVVKTTYDAYVYVCNAGTGNGTTDPATGTLTIIIEYYGID